MAGLETHDRVFELVREHLPRPADVVDLGAGQGAFSRRLASLGHEVVAVDADAGNWRVNEIDILELDLDSDFSGSFGGRRFKAAVAIEILEHVENPFAFVRGAANILEDGGLLFLTTPNVEALSSRLIFLYTGRLQHFGAWETVRPAHITPIFRWKLGMILEEAGFDIIQETFNRHSYRTGVNVKGRVAALAGRILEKFVKGETGGECRIIVARLRNRK